MAKHANASCTCTSSPNTIGHISATVGCSELLRRNLRTLWSKPWGKKGHSRLWKHCCRRKRQTIYAHLFFSSVIVLYFKTCTFNTRLCILCTCLFWWRELTLNHVCFLKGVFNTFRNKYWKVWDSSVEYWLFKQSCVFALHKCVPVHVVLGIIQDSASGIWITEQMYHLPDL
jgi:hypothetical protein